MHGPLRDEQAGYAPFGPPAFLPLLPKPPVVLLRQCVLLLPVWLVPQVLRQCADPPTFVLQRGAFLLLLSERPPRLVLPLAYVLLPHAAILDGVLLVLDASFLRLDLLRWGR